MKKTTLILAFLFTALTTFTFGQVVKKKNYFPLWTYHQKNVNIHGVSIGLGTFGSVPMHTNTNGIKIEIIGAGIGIPLIPESSVSRDGSASFTLSKKTPSETINGISLSVFGTICDCKTNGINVGLIGNDNYQINGINGSVFMNFTQIHNGLQFSLFNESYLLNGIQIGLFNYGAKTKGLQIGAGNSSIETKGLQIGIYNKSEKLKGFQFGIWNVNQKRKLPLINWSFK